MSALHELTGMRPRGYRAPFAELTPETLELLVEHRFSYDSSCMGDDRPYLEEHGAASILELPIHWALDDAPYFLTTLEIDSLLRDPDEVMAVWRSVVDLARSERRHVTYVMHPEVMGRGPQATALARFLDAVVADMTPWFATHAEVAAVAQSAASCDSRRSGLATHAPTMSANDAANRLSKVGGTSCSLPATNVSSTPSCDQRKSKSSDDPM
jgi:hypothetical protein